jgi:hypothetical protein
VPLHLHMRAALWAATILVAQPLTQIVTAAAAPTKVGSIS